MILTIIPLTPQPPSLKTAQLDRLQATESDCDHI